MRILFEAGIRFLIWALIVVITVVCLILRLLQTLNWVGISISRLIDQSLAFALLLVLVHIDVVVIALH